jgi:hypothetical protein
MQYETIDQVENFAAEHGIILTAAERARIGDAQAAERARIGDAQAAERARLESIAQDEPRTFADRFNEFYPRLLESIISIGETVLTFAQTLIVSFGVPVVLVLLLIVEHHRVVEGILLFDPNPTFASFAALALVMLNLLLEFQVHHIEHKAGYEQDRARRWSLRIWWANMRYRLGIGDNWTAQEYGPAERYRRLLRLVTFTILALALVGSMRTVIAGTEGAWYTAMVSIVTESNLLLMMTWLGGLLFAAAAVLSAQGLSRYVAIRCVEIVASMEARVDRADDPHREDVERAGAVVALAVVNAKLEKQRAKAAAKAKETENANFTFPVTAPEDEDTQPVNAVN